MALAANPRFRTFRPAPCRWCARADLVQSHPRLHTVQRDINPPALQRASMHMAWVDAYPTLDCQTRPSILRTAVRQPWATAGNYSRCDTRTVTSEPPLAPSAALPPSSSRITRCMTEALHPLSCGSFPQQMRPGRNNAKSQTPTPLPSMGKSSVPQWHRHSTPPRSPSALRTHRKDRPKRRRHPQSDAHAPDPRTTFLASFNCGASP